MHPAPSIIFFTAFSGLGFGLMAWMGLGYPNVTGWITLTFALIALICASVGLAASLFHLGNPQRFVLALSQWRSSWLSREGILAVATMALFAVYAALWAFTNTRVIWLGQICALMSILTVFATSMIYAQLKTVPRWKTHFTPALFILYSLTGGALLGGLAQATSLLMLILVAVQTAAWLHGDGRFAASGSTLASATGLGHLGRLRLLEPPHTGENYLLREMAFKIGRKHAWKLRMISLLAIGILPAALFQIIEIGHGLAVALIGLHLLGLFTARWLFFAEAEHVVGLYYDKR